MENLFYKGNVELCGKFQNGTILPCVTPMSEWLKVAVEKSSEFNLLNTEVAYGKENPNRNA